MLGALRPLSASQKKFLECSTVREMLADTPPPEGVEMFPRVTFFCDNIGTGLEKSLTEPYHITHHSLGPRDPECEDRAGHWN